MSLTNISQKSPFKVGSLGNEKDIEEAVELLLSGGVVVSQFRSVFGVWVRADNAKAVEKAIFGIKKRKSKRPMVAMMTSDSFLRLIDVESVHESLRPLILDPQEFQRRLGAISIVGAPINPKSAKKIPDSLLSQNKGQYKMLNLDPTGNPHMSRFVKQLVKSNIPYVGISSLNIENEKEIYNLNEAIAFVKSNPELHLLLTDPLGAREGVRGSFPIIDLETASAVRDGHIPIWVIENALGVHLNKTSMKTANFNYHKDFDKLKKSKYSPQEWHNMALKLTTE